MKRKFLEGNVDSSSSSSGWPDDDDDDDDADLESSHKNAPKPYACRAPQRESWPCRRDENGDLVALVPKESLWWSHYIENPPLQSSRFHSKFRHRFRLDYNLFLQLLEVVKSETRLFGKWTKKDAAGRDSSPIELLLLGTLRYIGRDAKLDDMEENTAVSLETHRLFLHSFLEFASTVLYERHVVAPNTIAEADVIQSDFAEAGLPGCIGSMDATHVTMLRCPSKLKNQHDGFKQNLPARTYNIVTNHRRGIISSTLGHPCRYNDKTLVMFDKFVKQIHEGEFLSEYQFSLLQEVNEEIVSVRYSGVWFITDNGYHNWSVTVPPYKDPVTYRQRRWSKWIESMRKDVECTFGILKYRFKCLHSGVRLHGLGTTDRLWLSCCALHNMILCADGQDSNWSSSADSEYVRNLGLIVGNDATRDLQINWEEIEVLASDPIPVRSLSLTTFRERLVEHFDILWRANKIRWPSRGGVAAQGNINMN